MKHSISAVVKMGLSGSGSPAFSESCTSKSVIKSDSARHDEPSLPS